MWLYGAGGGLIAGALLALWLNRLIDHERVALNLAATARCSAGSAAGW